MQCLLDTNVLNPMKSQSFKIRVHMAGSSQQQNFFAAGCVFADFAIAVIFHPEIKTL